MDNIEEALIKRWKAIEGETLSSVRRQLELPYFDMAILEHDFHKSCNEWFHGKMAPALWFSDLEESDPAKAKAFKECVDSLCLNSHETTKPNKLWAIAITALSIPVVYGALEYITNWQILGKSVFTIGTGVLVWTVCQSKIMSRQHNFEESVVDSYKKQLDDFCVKLKGIVS